MLPGHGCALSGPAPTRRVTKTAGVGIITAVGSFVQLIRLRLRVVGLVPRGGGILVNRRTIRNQIPWTSSWNR